MLKHAYLIMAHNNFDHLKRLIKIIDSAVADIFIQIDANAKNVN